MQKEKIVAPVSSAFADTVLYCKEKIPDERLNTKIVKKAMSVFASGKIKNIGEQRFFFIKLIDLMAFFYHYRPLDVSLFENMWGGDKHNRKKISNEEDSF